VRLDVRDRGQGQASFGQSRDALFVEAGQERMMPEAGRPSQLPEPGPVIGSPRVVGTLVLTYESARAALDGPSTPVSEPEALERALAAICARGRAAHPETSLSDEVFVAHLARCGAPVGGDGEAVFAADLYAACACLRGDVAAIAALRVANRIVLAGYLRRIDASKSFVDEVEQRLWDSILVGTLEAPPKLATYSGQGPLAGWLGIAAQRIALMARRHEDAEERAGKGAAAEAQLVSADPELAFMKSQFREQFQRAVSAALLVLDDRQRMIYRLHLIDGMTVDSIAKMYQVSQSTVSRWLADARKGVITEARQILSEELRLSGPEFESIAGIMVSQLDLSVSRILRK
jgi:RNA polymerase sigma-70 factor (ECF subfamily)